MHRLVYTSRATRKDIIGNRRKLEALAGHAAERNVEEQITGALMLVGDRFVQVLEGKFAFLEQTFERICCDFRHTDLRLIDMQPADERLFADWSMACLAADDKAPADFVAALEEIDFLVGTNPREAVQAMRALLEQTKPLRAAA